jgi:5S rRNA maturation endonuclease (ribonuclease M5)
MLNREIRYNLANRALASGIEENAEGTVILVEGKRDEAALRLLGFTGPIEKLNRGWAVDRVVVYIVETYGCCIVLMDWDRTGGRLQRRLMDSMSSLDIKPSDELRKALSKAMKPDTMCVEDLPSFLGEPDS